jgi:O-antigen ligase
MSDRARSWSPGQPGIKWSVTHNSFLQAGSELGVPGLILFTMLVWTCIAGPWRLRRRMPVEWASGDWEEQFMFHAAAYLPLSAIAFAVSGFFVSFAYQDAIYILAAMTGALAVAVGRRLNGPLAQLTQPIAPGRRVRATAGVRMRGTPVTTKTLGSLAPDTVGPIRRRIPRT